MKSAVKTDCPALFPGLRQWLRPRIILGYPAGTYPADWRSARKFCTESGARRHRSRPSPNPLRQTRQTEAKTLP